MYERWTKAQEDLLFSLYQEKTLDELAEIIGKNKEQIKTKGWRHGLIFQNIWSTSEDDYLKEHYLDMSYLEIGNHIGRSRCAVQARCRKLGLLKALPPKKKEINSNYFENIDTEEKAYWLGFICADGCVSWNKHSKAYQFKITLQQSDKDFLQKFITAIGGDFDVNLKIQKVKFNDTVKEYPICEVSFKDKKFTSDLLKYFSENKTEYLRIPKQIPEDLIRHFIRGFSDGDGCFYCNTEKKDKSFEIVGKCYDMLNDIKNEFGKSGIYSEIYKKRKTNWKVGIYRLNELIKLHSYLYDGATIFMERKYLKSQEILKLAS